MMNSVSSSNFTLSSTLLEDEENKVCKQILPISTIFGCFTLAVVGFLVYYFVFA